MVQTTVILLALSICLAQCATLRGKDDPRERGKRSYCHVCEDGGPPHGPFGLAGPPPPPPFFRTQQWSGLARGDGGQHSVFSGAAAAADSGPQAVGQAFSVASADSDAGTQSGYGGQSAGDGVQSAGDGVKSAGYGVKSAGFGVKSAGYGVNSAGYGVKSAGYSGQSANSGLSSANAASQTEGQSAGGVGGGAVGYGGQKKFSGSGTFKESHYSFQSGGSKHFDSAGGAGSTGDVASGSGGSASVAASGAAVQGFGGQHQFHLQGSNAHGIDNQGEGAQTYGAGSSGSVQRQEQHGSIGIGQGHGTKVSSQLNDDSQRVYHQAGNKWDHGSNSASSSQSGDFGASGGSSAGYSGGAELQGSSSQGSGHSALNGALNLASQSLQTSQQAGCSTCGKGGYALSNAKSKTGDAVAVSIGG